MKINWKVRVKNKLFWLSIIPAVLLLLSLLHILRFRRIYW
ncbi:phage holin family protein, partial [Enterococcus cecorum]|nr:phage holin family protein [Enterococcus cecorum]